MTDEQEETDNGVTVVLFDGVGTPIGRLHIVKQGKAYKVQVTTDKTFKRLELLPDDVADLNFRDVRFFSSDTAAP